MLENRDVFLKIIDKLKSIATNIGTAIPDVSQIESDIETLQTSVGGLQTGVEGLQTSVGGLQTGVEGLQTSVGGLTDDSYFKAGDEVTPAYVPVLGVANGVGTSIAFALRLNKSMKNVVINSNTLNVVSPRKYDGSDVTSPSISSVSKSGDYDIMVYVSASVTSYATYNAYFNGKITFANPT